MINNMKVEELTSGFIFYDCTRNDFTIYHYLCEMPNSQGHYHIIIDHLQQKPIRIYKRYLQDILDKGLFTKEALNKEQLRLAKDWVKYLSKKENQL